MTPIRSLVESALLSALGAALFLASNFIPVAGAFLTLLCPAPLVILGLRHSLKNAVLGMSVASLVSVLFLGIQGGLFFFLGFGVLGVGLGALARSRERGVEILFYGVLISLVSKLALVAVMVKLTGVNPFSFGDPAQMEAVVDRVFRFYASHGMDPKSLEQVKAQLMQTFRMLPDMFPALITMASALDTYLSYTVTRALSLRVSMGSLPALPKFSRWRFPKSVLWAFLFSVVLSVAAGPEGRGVLAQGALNLRIVLQMLFFLQGAAVMWYFLERRGVSRGFRFLLAALLVLVPFLSGGAIMVGLLDIWWDFRTRFGGDVA
ncbi:MAG: YybS family protein [Thermanaerothrix sp.]|nr:YybS family protein [Thermanaerothrix sp.]